MTSKKTSTANPRLVVWLPSILFAFFIVWWAVIPANGSYSVWLEFGIMIVLLAGSIASGIFAIRRHESLRQSSWLHMLNMFVLTAAILWLLWVVAEIYLIIAWPM